MGALAIIQVRAKEASVRLIVVGRQRLRLRGRHFGKQISRTLAMGRVGEGGAECDSKCRAWVPGRWLCYWRQKGKYGEAVLGWKVRSSSACYV